MLNKQEYMFYVEQKLVPGRYFNCKPNFTEGRGKRKARDYLILAAQMKRSKPATACQEDYNVKLEENK